MIQFAAVNVVCGRYLYRCGCKVINFIPIHQIILQKSCAKIILLQFCGVLVDSRCAHFVHINAQNIVFYICTRARKRACVKNTRKKNLKKVAEIFGGLVTNS